MNRLQFVSAGGAAVVLAAAAVGIQVWWKSTSDQDRPTVAEVAPPAEPRVQLSDHKRQIAGIRAEQVRRGMLRPTRILPARIAYDETQHVAVRAGTDGVLERISVKPGDRVTCGDPLAFFRSPAVGEARSEVLSRQADFELARREAQWQQQICDGVQQLVEAIRAGKEVEVIESMLQRQGRALGNYRANLLNAYNRSRLADRIAESTRQMGDSGAVSGRVLRERESDQQQAKAALEALIEQSLFETQQACREASAAKDQAERLLRIARQQLETLLGVASQPVRVSAEQREPAEISAGDLSQVEIRSPLTGTVEQIHFSSGERVRAGEPIIVVADTSQLWVEADVRLDDWATLRVGEGDQVTVWTMSGQDAPLPATVYFAGRAVDPASGALPLIAQLDNAEGRLRPGMFARMEVPLEKVEDVLLVPESAVTDLDGQSSVFVVTGEGYRPLAVELGRRADGQIEVRSGLVAGDEVVVEGTFALKSELLLEGEE